MKRAGTSKKGGDTKRGGSQGWFPSTHWSKLLAVGDSESTKRRNALNFLLQRYWKPVYCYLRRCGYGEEDAKDLVQEFFASCLCTDFFAQADPARGRFRNFLLGSLKHFLANVQRAEHAQKRRPLQGLVSLEDLADSDGGGFEPAGSGTPEAVFHRAWVADLTHRVLCRLESECQATDKLAHYEILRQRLVLPALEGADPPPMRDLARRLSLTEKQAANYLLTARRAFQRLLEEEIRSYSSSEDEMAVERCDLRRFLGEP